MRKQLTIRIFAWLLLLALPFQGFAASMLMCGHSQQTTVQAGTGHQTHQHHANNTQLAAHAPADTAADSTATSVEHTHSKLAFGDGKCNSCSTCCSAYIGIALGSLGNSPAVAQRISPLPATSFVNFTPDDLDPPPRQRV